MEARLETETGSDAPGDQIIVGVDWAELFEDELDKGHFAAVSVRGGWATIFDFATTGA
jgi:hypothetical protein